MKSALLRCLMPILKRPAIGQPQLCQGVGDMKFHRFNADSTAFRDLTAGHAVLDGMHDPPLGGRQ